MIGICGGWTALVEASAVANGACAESAVGIVDAVDLGADVGGELRGADIPVDDFGDAVAEGAGVSGALRVVDGTAGVGVEGCQS